MSPEHVSAGDTALLESVSPSRHADRPLWVVVIAGDAVFATRVATPIVVGRDDGCELVLADHGTSRRHARLIPRGTAIEVTDLESRNGTFVDGHPAQVRSLAHPGSVIRIGGFALLVAQLDEGFQAADLTGPLVGGAAIAPVRRTVGLVAPTELPVMLLGETGTGKEVVARLVHAMSGRTGPFVAVNCASLPENLVDSELFGHVRGAFTGATHNRQGLLALADAGTLFLDELGELPLAAQAKLLRVLEDGVVRPVGAERSSRIDVRFICATNVNFEKAIEDGRFRTDLFARLSAVEITLPSLRARRDDIPALAKFLATRANLEPLTFTPDAMEALLLHSWPHNIRELDNLVRALALGGSAIDLADLPPHLQAQLREARRGERPPRARSEGDMHAHSEVDIHVDRGEIRRSESDMRARVVDALQTHNGNVRRVAVTLGVARGHVYRLLKRFHLEPASFRGGAR